MLKAIIFDWDGVLGNSSAVKAAKMLSKQANKSPEEILELIDIYDEPYLIIDNDDDYYTKLANEFNEDFDTMKKLLCDITFTDLYDSLDNFKEYDLYLLSNQTATRTKEIKKAIDFSMFKELFFSDELALRKPNYDCYELVLKRICLKPEECLFIDDKKRNTDAAKGLGINVFTYNDNKDELIVFLNSLK